MIIKVKKSNYTLMKLNRSKWSEIILDKRLKLYHIKTEKKMRDYIDCINIINSELSSSVSENNDKQEISALLMNWRVLTKKVNNTY